MRESGYFGAASADTRDRTVTSVIDRWAVGNAYEAFMGRWSRALAPRFVDWLEVAPRAHWLDVGCGTGALTSAICEYAAPASVVACDPSGPLIEQASAMLPDKRVSFEIAGDQHLPQRDEGFDVVVSGLVVNFVADPVRALAAMRARLAARGCVAAYVWDYVEGMPLLRSFWSEAVALDPECASLAEHVRFSRCNPKLLGPALQSAGLQRVEATSLDIETNFDDFEDYWRPFLGRTGPAPSYLASIGQEQRERLRERLRQRLTRQSDGRICLRARAWALRGFLGE
jgi:SAM-dependent methyltransferase